MKVFISHSSQDHEFVLLLANKLRNDGFDVWIDEWELKVGDSIVDKINKGIESSSAFIIVVSGNSLDSNWVKKELSASLMRQLTSRKIKILPVLLDIRASALPPLLSDTFAVKFSSDVFSEKAYKKLKEPIVEIKQTAKLTEYQDKFFDDIQYIDLILSKKEPTKNEVKIILDIIKKDQYYNYFFKKVQNVFWFNILKDQNMFKPSTKIGPQPADREDSYTLPYWEPLVYFEKISKQIKIGDNEEYAHQLFEIMREVTNFHIKNSFVLDNYYLWWGFIKVLLNIPSTLIPIDIIELFSIWCESKFPSSLAATDLVMKLLPRFLNIDEKDSINKAEKIVEIITDVKLPDVSKVTTRTYFKKEKSKLIIESYWLLKGFKKIAQKFGKICSNNIVFIITDRIFEIFKNERGDTYFDIEVQNKNYRIFIQMIERTKFKIYLCEIENDKNDDLDTLDKKIKEIFLEFEIEHCKNEHDFSASVIKYLGSQYISELLIKKIGEDLKDSYLSLFNDYSYIRINSLYDDPKVGEKNADITLITILKKILLSKANMNIEPTRKVILKLLSDLYIYPIFKRLGLYIIGNYWDDYKDIFRSTLKDKEAAKYFDSPNFEPELSELIKLNHDKFDCTDKQIIKQIIENGPYHKYATDDEEKKKEYSAYWKQKWYALLESDPEFKKLYNEQRKIIDVPKEKFKYKTEIITRWGPGPSPYSKEELEKLSSDKIVDIIKTFKQKNNFDGPTVGALAHTFKDIFQSNPEKFVENLNLLDEVGYIYIYEIISALRNLLKEKSELDWNEVFNFLHSYIDRESFWNDKYIVDRSEWLSNADCQWVVGEVGELIQEIADSERVILNEELLSKIQKVLLMIIDRLKYETEDTTDYVTYMLNTPFGKNISALLSLSLTKAKLTSEKDSDKTTKWEIEYKIKFEELIKRGIVEVFTIFGRFIPNFYYLDKEWTESKIKSFGEIKYNKVWEAFMQGYLSIPQVYDNLYLLMVHHYRRSLEYSFKDERCDETVVEHIAISYLRGHEKIDNTDSMFIKILQKWNDRDIKTIVDLFWREHKYLDKNNPEHAIMINRIQTFFYWVFINKYKDRNIEDITASEESIISSLSHLIVYFEKIDEENWSLIELCANFVHVDYNSSFFIENLDKIDDRDSLIFVGKAYLKMIESFTPDYDKEHIRSIVEKLYVNKEKQIADQICNIYGERCFEFLRDIYLKFNQS